MFKKIILAVATFGIICVAYVIYQWQDATTTRSPRVAEPPVRPVARRAVATQPAASRPEDATFSFKGARIPPGESPRVSVFDDKGNARYVFQCTGWKPLSDNEFHITNPTARLLLPGGQLAYVWADEGQVVFQRGDGNALNPKSGWLRGHVRIFIDRTRPKEREENPDRGSLEQHPEAVVKIWLEDVSFDLDLDRLDSKGPVVVQSVDASIEGEGLELIWNEVDRRVRLLQINKGKRATLHSSKLAKFSLAGGSETPQQTSGTPERKPAAPKPAPPAPLQDDRGLAFQDLEAASATSPKEDRVDTYRIEFQGGVSARQTEGARVVGSLTDADVLELLADIGREDRDAVEHAQGTEPSEAKAAQTRPVTADALARNGQMPMVPVRSMVELEWSGKLIARPLEATEQPAGTPGERLHLVARGTPVTVHDEQNGEASCTELEYHGETKQIWLRGTETHPVRMDSASRGQLTVQKMTFDPKTGVASVDGPGRMVSDRRSRSEVPAGDPLDTGASQGEISWTRSALLEFGRVPAAKTSGGEQAQAGEPRQRSEYIKRAVFDGGVAMREGESSIAAGHLEAFFAEPRPGADSEGLVATRIAAHDNVVFEQRSDRKAQAERVQCDRLEVEMDGTADNLPKVARAFGNVIATQRGERSAREIRAREQLELTLASLPRPITPEERQRLEVMARQNPDVKPGSPKWVAMEAKLAARRRTVAQSMTASGQVVVNIRDGKEAGRNLGLIADTLDCTFSNGEEIERALVVGSEERPASVDTGDVYVKGPQIVVDMDAQLVEVPGGGLMRFMTREDLDGRAVDRPVPVVVSWKDRMVMRGKENRGTFTGSVRAASETTILDCRELRIEFQDVARADAPEARASAYWIFGPVVSAVGETAGPSGGLLTRQMRKRPVYLWAVGDAVIESSSFEQGPERGGAISGAFFRSMPMAWRASRPETGKRGRLLSRLRAAGPQIRIDLVERHFGIEGVGNMSIEDYRIPQRSARGGGARTGSLAAGRISGGLDSLGPSQTVFTWQSSMTYLNHRNLAVFDDSVKMNHVSGGAMVMKAELAAAMNLDPERLGKLESRQARLDCDNLLVEFDRDRTQAETGPSPLSRATKLKRFEAKGAVQLALDGGRQAVTGTVVTYASESGEVKVTGSPAWPAQILEQDERTAKLNVVRAEPGKAISWNEKTRIARIEGSSLLGTGR